MQRPPPNAARGRAGTDMTDSLRRVDGCHVRVSRRSGDTRGQILDAAAGSESIRRISSVSRMLESCR